MARSGSEKSPPPYSSHWKVDCELGFSLSRQWHLAGRVVCDGLTRRKARGLLLSGSMAAATAVLLELDPFFMLLDPGTCLSEDSGGTLHRPH